MDGTGLRFETMEHGGEYPHTMPQAIKLIDGEGRPCTYLSIMQDGKCFALRSSVARTQGRPTGNQRVNCFVKPVRSVRNFGPSRRDAGSNADLRMGFSANAPKPTSRMARAARLDRVEVCGTGSRREGWAPMKL